MKTSNKILVGALAAYLLLTVVDTACYVREHNAVEEAATDFFEQLEKTPIHTLATTGERPFRVSAGNGPKMVIGSWERFDADCIRIAGDTLYLTDPRGYVRLPEVKTHLRNGVPIPVD